MRTSQFSFDKRYKWHAIRQLCLLLNAGTQVLTVSTMELCRYLEAHSNLGKARSIQRTLYRVKQKL